MYADFVEMYASAIASAGVGNITMAQLTGSQMGGSYSSGALPKFSTVFGTSEQVVKYIIEDITSAKYEKGIGRVNVSVTDVLTRDLPRVTWDGTTLTQVGAVALAFTASSQNIRVRIAPCADDFVPTIPAMVNSAAPFSTQRGLISAHLTPYTFTNSASLINGFEAYAPYLWTGQGEIDQIAMWCSTAAASHGVKVALYQMLTNGLPGQKIFDNNTNPFDFSTTGYKALSMSSTSAGANIRPPLGWYIFGYIATDNTIQSIGGNSGFYDLQTPWGFGYGNGAEPYHGIYKSTGSNSYATGMPANGSAAGSFTAHGLQQPFFFMRPKQAA